MLDQMFEWVDPQGRMGFFLIGPIMARLAELTPSGSSRGVLTEICSEPCVFIEYAYRAAGTAMNEDGPLSPRFVCFPNVDPTLRKCNKDSISYYFALFRIISHYFVLFRIVSYCSHPANVASD
jgi:hypothetical protein